MVRGLIKDREGSVAPLVVYVLGLVVYGLLWGILNIIMIPVYNAAAASATKDLLWNVWIYSPVGAFLILSFWLLMKAQKDKLGGVV